VSLAIRHSTVDGVVRRSAHTFRDRVALVFGDREWTYAALDDAVSRAASRLLGLGLH
jgi:fatty-acyl-CoA synthase